MHTWINNWEGDLISSTLAFLPFLFPPTFPKHRTMEPAKRMAVGGAWDHLPEEVVSLITIKVAETSEDLLEDLRSL
jgi:hypothetical protein